MPFVLVKDVRCLCCDKPTPLLASSLERILDNRSGSSSDETQLFFACPHCNTVAQPDIAAQSTYRTIPERQQHPEGRVLFGALLECAQKGCSTRIEVLGTSTTTDMSNLQEQKPWRTWNFGREVQCENMHPPMNPAEIASLQMGN